MTAGTKVAEVTAPTRLLLTAERTALNLLCHLSGVAIVDAAVGRCAGGHRGASSATPARRRRGCGRSRSTRCAAAAASNHRMGLSDMALVKDNHVAAAGGVTEAFRAVRELAATIPVEIEVDTLDGLREAIAAGADEVLIDNFTPDEMREAVAVRDELNPAVRLEASGGLTLESARAVGRDRRRLHRRRRTHPLGAGARHRPRPANPSELGTMRQTHRDGSLVGAVHAEQVDDDDHVGSGRKSELRVAVRAERVRRAG